MNLVELLNVYISSEKGLNTARILDLFHSNARLIDHWGNLHIGKHEIKAFYNDFFTKMNIQHVGSEQMGSAIKISYILSGHKLPNPTRAVNYIKTRDGLIQQAEIVLLK